VATSSAITPNTSRSDAGWGPAKRVSFRVLFSYLALYLVLSRFLESDLHLEASLGFAPGAGPLLAAYAKLWAPVVVWAGKSVLRVSRPLAFAAGGNSDGIFGFVQLFCFAVLALIAALIWTLLGRGRAEYRRLNDWLRIGMRYALVFSLFGYGTVKVINVQFPFPRLQDLLTPFGNSSPFLVLANFMGTSRAYTFFTGAGEIVAAGLLCFRRTTTLGALVAFAIMLNVTMLNFSYDWPEKLDALHLLLLSVLLLGPDAGRLVNVLVLNRPALPASLGARPATEWMRIGQAGVKTVVIAYILVTNPLMALNLKHLYFAHSPLYGIYNVEEFARNGQLSLPLTTDAVRWKTVVFDSPDAVSVRLMDDTWHYYRVAYDGGAKKLTLFSGRRDSPTKNDFACAQSGRDDLVLQGTFRTDALIVKLKRFDESTLALVNSRFRWINGQP
jgi:hypothetical protein